MKKILITGGQASGKSSLAIKLADNINGKRIFIASARYIDGELKEKIENHIEERGNRYQTIEEPIDLINALNQAVEKEADVIVIDCITMWISNLLIEKGEQEMQKYIDTFIDGIVELQKDTDTTLITVTNECGSGVIPANELSRKYVKYLGRTNKKLAAVYDEVYMTCCGLEMKIK